MKITYHSLPLWLLLLLPFAEAAANKVKLSNVRTLTLRQGQKTAGRRLAPIPQLKCVGGDAKGLYEIDVMRCKNMGSDYGDEDVSWSCTADVPKYFKLGSTDVLCEGYSNPSDPYILKGSCGVEYRLMLTDAGYEKYGHNQLRSLRIGGIDWFAVFFWIVFSGIVGAMIYSACTGGGGGDRRMGRRVGGGGGGPWFGGGGDPPPPYSGPPPSYSKYPPGTQGDTWRPGFWSGLAAGAAGSYLMRGGRERETREPRTFFMNEPTSMGSSSFFGGGGGGFGSGRTSRTFEYEDHGEGSSRQSTTGFGQTRRR